MYEYSHIQNISLHTKIILKRNLKK